MNHHPAPLAPDDAPLPALPQVPPGVYRHHKGGWYEVLGTARCSETLQGMVLYRALTPEAPATDRPTAPTAQASWAHTWVRPAAIFVETVAVAGQTQPRFAPANLATQALMDAPTARAVVAWYSAQCMARGITLRAAPPPPTTCCGRGCNGCVWEGYYTALHHWRGDAHAALAASGGG